MMWTAREAKGDRGMLDISRVSFDFAPGDDQVSVWYDANGECALIGQTQDGKYALVYVAGREEFLHHAFCASSEHLAQRAA